MKEGDFVRINYTARELNNKKVFETTNEEIAKKEGIYNEKGLYGSIIIKLGEGEVVKGLEENIIKMQEGEEKKIIVKAEKAFGERKPELIKIIPIQEFKQKKINPFPGLIVNINNAIGKVQSISGGRVRVDFNHELAGKEIEYTVKVEELIKGEENIASALIEKYFPFIEEKKFKIEKDILKLEIPIISQTKLLEQVQFIKQVFAERIMKETKINEIEFIEVIKRKKTEETKEKKETTIKERKKTEEKDK